MNNNLLDIKQVAEKFNKSVRIMRDYKRLSIIKPVAKDGMKDLYDPNEILMAKEKVEEHLIDKNLSEIAGLVSKERRKARKA